MTKPPLVVFLYNIISPHNIPLFSELAKSKDINSKFLFLSATDPNRPWTAIGKLPFDYEILPHKRITLGRQDSHSFYFNGTLWSRLRRINPEILVINGWDHPSYWLAVIYAKVFGKKLVLRSGSTCYESSWRRTVSLPLVELLVSAFDSYLAYGSRAELYLHKLGADPKRITLAFNTTDLAFYGRAVHLRRLRQKVLKKQIGLPGKTIILFYGQLITRKNPLPLLQAYIRLLPEYPDLGLVYVGNGPQKKFLSDTVKRYGLHRQVKIFAYPGENRIINYYAAADIFLLPSTQEVWGLVINQAMAAGLPVITTRQTGAGADLVIPGVTGMVSPDALPINLGNTISALLNADYRKIGKNASQHVQNFSPVACSRQFVSVLKSL